MPKVKARKRAARRAVHGGLDEEIRDAIKAGRLTIGTRTTMKNLMNGGLEKAIYASNAPENAVKDLEHYSGINGTAIEKFSGNSMNLGEACVKPFSILMVGIIKPKK